MINLSTKSLLTPLFQNSTSSKSNSSKIHKIRQLKCLKMPFLSLNLLDVTSFSQGSQVR